MRFLLPAVLAFLPFTSAFYPYIQPEEPQQPPSQNSPRAVSSSLRDVAHSDLRVAIRKLPTKRVNTFNVLRASAPAQENSLGIDQDGTDFSYFCAFKFGTSNKEFYMLLDSAASNAWVMSGDCTTTACGVHTLLGATDSTSLQIDQQRTFSVTYGTGSVQGIQGSDTAHLGGISVPLIFGLAQNVSDEFGFFPMDGILGLGRTETLADRSGTLNVPPLMDVLISEQIIPAKMFGMDLWRAADGGPNTGVLNFGSPDSSRYEGDLNYVAAVRNINGFWEVPVADAGVDGNIAGLPGRTAIIDSGTSYILMPHDDAVQLHELIRGYARDGNEMFTIPCDTTARVQFTLGGVTYDIDPRDYVGRRTANGACSSNIIGRQTFGARQWLVGDVFLKNVYTLYDFDGQRIGFGIKRAVTPGGTPASTGSGTSPASPTSSNGATLLPPGTASGSGAASDSNEASVSTSSPGAANEAKGRLPPMASWAALVLLGLWSGMFVCG